MESLNSITFSHFDTLCQLSADVDDDILCEAEHACGRFERLYSRFDPQSSLSRINASAGSWVSVEPEVADAIRTSLAYCEATSGLFDVTMGSVCQLWNFKQGVLPRPEDIDEALGLVDWRQVQVEGASVRLAHSDAVVDLGGIAKGIIADALAKLLVREGGATSGCINLGGNVLVIGSKPNGQPWNVGLRNPMPSPDPFKASTFATIALCGKSVVTSGVFERAFVHDGQLLHHILDPRTGTPAVTDVLSASVITESSTEGDGLTTALIIMGSEAALAFAEARPGVEAVLFTADGRVLHTSGLVGESTHFSLAR